MRILLIEDNPGDARLIREMLSEANGGTAELECEETLASGLERLASERFDVLLLDLTLPDSQGLETLHRVHPSEQKVPVVVLTGLEDDETAQKSLENGAQDYLVIKGKISADSLVRVIRYAMVRRSAEEALAAGSSGLLIKPFKPNELFESIEGVCDVVRTGVLSADHLETERVERMDTPSEEDEKDTATVVRAGAGLDPGTAEANCTHTFKTIEDLQPGNNLCCIYDTEEEHRVLLTPYLKNGLDKHEKVIYIVDAHTAETVLGYLRDAGVEVEPYLSSGQLAILSVGETYMASGEFDPDGMIGILTDETEKALAEGYSALRVTSEMSWALKGLPGSERLMEYEAKLNRFFPGSKCLAISQYDNRMFEPSLLLNVLSTHPIAVIGTELFDNFYYVPPDEFLSSGPALTTLDHWVSSMRERKATEETLRVSEEKYRTLFENMLEGFAFCRMVYDDDGHPVDWFYLDANKAFEPLTGLENVVGRYATEIMPGIKETNPEVFEIYGRVASTGKPEQLEIRVEPLSRDLSIKVFSPVKDCFAAVFENITERKRAGEEIRRLGHRLMEESDRVRITIAADLHDDVGQSLSAIKMAFDIQRKKMAGAAADDETGERMANIRDMLSETIDKVRNITVGLAPVELTDLGLDSALQSYLEDFARDTGATCAFKTEGARVQAGVEVKTALFRIAQEALANIRKHSKASNVEVSVSWSESLVSLSVHDDGAGFDVDKVYEESRAGDHFGLLGMRERARMLKGEFVMESEPVEGTTVTVSVPLERS